LALSLNQLALLDDLSLLNCLLTALRGLDLGLCLRSSDTALNGGKDEAHRKNTTSGVTHHLIS
jgi:hypothetical protein